MIIKHCLYNCLKPYQKLSLIGLCHVYKTAHIKLGDPGVGNSFITRLPQDKFN